MRRILAVRLLPSDILKYEMLALVGRGEVKNNGPANGKIRALRARNLIISTVASTIPNAAAFAQILDLFLNESGHENDTWTQAQSWQLPDTAAASAWLKIYNDVSQQAQESWERFVKLQQQVDATVADWYGFNATMRKTIDEGLPWARRRRNVLHHLL
jgi:hypothetical protein